MIFIPNELEPVAVEWATQILTARGAVITWPEKEQPWETLATLIWRVQALCPEPRPTEACLRSRISNPACPAFPRTNHPSGRLKRLIATPELIRFLTQAAQPGEAL